LIDRLRSRRSRAMDKHIPLDDIQLASRAASPEEIVKSKEGIEMFTKVLDSLEADCRKAFVLNRIKGYTYDEVAKELCISRSTVRRHISYVLVQLGTILEKCI
ncbi:MAG: sigma-70 family RNA polymerase sigma factor, partial [Deltaproteobacteria bacterium]|nr:sigma-70 family RNA polymerase sigma factor [Deltaproteobacteria bacterium]